MGAGGGVVGRRGIALAVVVAATLGCDENREIRRDPERRGRCDLGGFSSCRQSADCGPGASCFEGCCLSACGATADCDAAPGCDGFGCVCDQGACIPVSCSAAEECEEGQACVGGVCVGPGAVEARFCRLSPPWATLRAGDEMRYAVAAFDAEGRRIVPTPAFRLESPDARRAIVDGDRVTGGPESGRVEIVAKVGAASCTAEVLSLGQKDPDRVRVVAIDALSRLPVEGARVQVEGDPSPALATTDARGEASLERGALPARRTVSVFHEDHTYVTLVDVEADDLLVPLLPNPDGPLAGGFSGAFRSELFEASRLNFGLAGASFPGNLLDLDVFVLVGPVERVEIDIGGARSADVSAGLVIGLGNTWFKERYRVEALPGACEDREASASGRCGFRTAWGLAGGIPLEDVPFDAIQSGGEVEAGRLLAQLLPHVRRLRSAVVPSLPIEFAPRVDGRPDWAALPTLDLEASTRLSLRVDLALPPLPSELVDGAVAVAGARVLGEGVVPLGLTGAVADEETRELVDAVRDRRGVLDLRFAPQHGGIEGSDYVVYAIAVNLEGLSGGLPCTPDERSGCTPISGLVAAAQSLPWGTVVDLSSPGFLGLADRALFDPATRRLDIGGEVEGATLMRVEILSRGRGWLVYFPSGLDGVTLPVPAETSDRLEEPSVSLQAMDADLDLDALLGPGGEDLSDFTLRARRFSAIDVPRPAPSR